MKAFVVMAVACIAIALIYQAAGCDIGRSKDGCTYDMKSQTYICPDER